MQKQITKTSDFLISVKLGFFLALRQVKHSNKATTALIIFVMTLTFLNLVVVRGVLVGLIQSTIKTPRTTTRFKKVKVITKIISAVVALFECFTCLSAKKNPSLTEIKKSLVFVICFCMFILTPCNCWLGYNLWRELRR